MTWQIDGSRARLTAGDLAGEFDLPNPIGGVIKFEVSGHAFNTGQFLAVRVPHRPQNDPPVETYIRGADLIVKYPPRHSDLVSHYVYYSALSEPSGLGLILSAQTSLLNSVPQTEVFSSFGPGELLVKLVDDEECKRVPDTVDYDQTRPPQFFLMRPASANISLVLFVHPQDFVAATVGPAPSVSYRVFPNSLEKGVIRRVLFRLSAVPRKGDDAAASALLEKAVQAAPPLAT